MTHKEHVWIWIANFGVQHGHKSLPVFTSAQVAAELRIHPRKVRQVLQDFAEKNDSWIESARGAHAMHYWVDNWTPFLDNPWGLWEEGGKHDVPQTLLFAASVKRTLTCELCGQLAGFRTSISNRNLCGPHAAEALEAEVSKWNQFAELAK